MDKELGRFEKSIEDLEKEIIDLKKDAVSKTYLLKMLTGFGIGLSLLNGLGMKVSLLEDLQNQDSRIGSLFQDIGELSNQNNNQNKIIDHLKEYFVNHQYHGGYDKNPLEEELSDYPTNSKH